MTQTPEFRQPNYQGEHGSRRQYLDFLGALTSFKNDLICEYALDMVEKLYVLGYLEFSLRIGSLEVGEDGGRMFETTSKIIGEIKEYSELNKGFGDAILQVRTAIIDFST